jgi:AmiR/NasT family two-component response regulator
VPRPTDFRLAQTLAELATIGILSQRELRQSQRLARQLQHALDSRVVIEQAKGAVSAWLAVSPADAFELLRSYARARSLPLPHVAADVLAGTTPAGALVTGGGRARRARERPPVRS